MMVMDSRSASLAPGKMIRAPVWSRIFWMWVPCRPIRNLWCSGLAFTSTVTPDSCFSSASSLRSFTAFSTSSEGPRMVTLSEPEPGVGNLMATPPHSLMMDWMSLPPANHHVVDLGRHHDVLADDVGHLGLD